MTDGPDSSGKHARYSVAGDVLTRERETAGSIGNVTGCQLQSASLISDMWLDMIPAVIRLRSTGSVVCVMVRPISEHSESNDVPTSACISGPLCR